MATTLTSAQAAEMPATAKTTVERYLALDAYRGLIMILLVSSGFGFHALAKNPTYAWIAAQLDHVPWEGAVFWDLIQPAFMFMVGVAMPFALARRTAQGATFRQNFWHVFVRSVKLILLSQILISVSGGKLSFQLVNVLAQIAFTYFFCFLIMQMRFRWQAVAAALILAFHWGLFVAFPGPQGPFSKTGNIGAVIDLAVLGHNYGGYYVTINFISSTVTTLFGVWTGALLMGSKPRATKLKILGLATAACLAFGLALTPVNLMIKRLWTASFTLYSTGWVLLMMLVFVVLIDVLGRRKFAFPLVVVGMNCIFIYSIFQVLQSWLNRAIGVFTHRFEWIGTLAPVAQTCATLLVMWYLCYWLYQRKVFFKL